CDETDDRCVQDAGACACTVDADCDDGDVCNGIESCNLDTYTCVNGAPPAQSSPCDDGRYCTVDDHCAGGACVGAARDCGDSLACSADSCDDAGDTCVSDLST